MTTSETCAPSTPARLSVSWIATLPKSWAGSVANAPLTARAGVRAAATMTISSFILVTPLLGLDGGGGLPVGLRKPHRAPVVHRPLPHPWNLGTGLSIGRIAGLFCINSPRREAACLRRRGAADKTVAGLERKRLCCPTDRREPSFTHGCRTGHHQEIR